MSEKRSSKIEIVIATEDPRSSSSLVPMLVGGVVLTLVGMLAALAFS